MTASFPNRAGVTLPEIMVVLVLLGLLGGVVGLSWRPSPGADPADQEQLFAKARRRALESGSIVRIPIEIDSRTVTVAVFPDGRVVAPAALRLDPLTGRPVPDSARE